jgi:hypothetical protein
MIRTRAYLFAALFLAVGSLRLYAGDAVEDIGGASGPSAAAAWVLPDLPASPETTLKEVRGVLDSGAGKALLEDSSDLRILRQMDPASKDQARLFAALDMPSPEDPARFIERFKSARLELAELVNERCEHLMTLVRQGKITDEKEFYAAAADLKAFRD